MVVLGTSLTFMVPACKEILETLICIAHSVKRFLGVSGHKKLLTLFK